MRNSRRIPKAAWIASIAVAGVILVATTGGWWSLGRQVLKPGTHPLTTLPNIADSITSSPSPSPDTRLQIIYRTETQPTLSPSLEISPSSTDVPLLVHRTAPVTGGADKVAFLNEGEIWAVNLDGSELEQLTQDGNPKTNLQWAIGGVAVYFLSEGCIRSVELESHAIHSILCLDEEGLLGSFQFSPDEKRLAIVVDRGLYLVEAVFAVLKQVSEEKDLEAIAACPALAPYKQAGREVAVKSARWSQRGEALAIVRPGLDDGKLVDLVHLLEISDCESSVRRLDEFPGKRFKMEGYDLTPVLQNIAWDGSQLFALISYRRNEGFGDLWIYNSELHRSDLVNPLNGACCYRDPTFSPDGKYLMFAFQDKRSAPGGKILLYYVPLATIGTGLRYAPVPLPDGFFPDPHSQPQPVLRTAR